MSTAKIARKNEDRPWATLPYDVLEKIHKLLPVPDFHIFGAVCKPWREVAEQPQYKPAPATTSWAIVANSKPPQSPHLQLYCRSRRTVHTLDLPPAIRLCHVQGVYKGWLLLLYPLNPRLTSSSRTVFLYNPFSRQTIHPEGPRRGWPAVSVVKMVLSSSPDDPHSALACLAADGSVHCRWLHRNESLIVKNYEGFVFIDIVSHSGSVFLLTRDPYFLLRLNLTHENLAPQERCVLINGNLMNHILKIYTLYKFLVCLPPFMILSDWGDRLVLHHIVALTDWYGRDNNFKVHNFFVANIEQGKWELLPELGDQAVLCSRLLASKRYSTPLSAADWGLRKERVYEETDEFSWCTDGTVLDGDELAESFTDKHGTRFSYKHQWLLPSH